ITTNASANGSLEITIQTEKINFTVDGNYDYNYPLSTLNSQSNKPYATQQYSAEFSWQLPLKFNIVTDAQYVINTKRTTGYNISYVIWNASIGKAFLKNENLILSIKGNDILNQNISATRTVNANVITDNKTNIIKRYIMLQLLWKFNSQKKKEEDDWD
ncbi:MAG: outer membrane beta-barrel protein, partial [Bacteroidia bacterium]